MAEMTAGVIRIRYKVFNWTQAFVWRMHLHSPLAQLIGMGDVR
jgi:hypothetical protein